MIRYLNNQIPSLLSSIFIAILVVSGLIMPAHAATGIAASQTLRAKLDSRPQVGVIVTFESLGSVSAGKTEFARRAFSSRLNSAQQSLLNQLPGVDKRRARSYKFVPQMAMSVNQQALERLLANPNIKVAYDAPHKLLLAQSVPLVFPDQQTTPYDGGNEWAVAVLDSGVDTSHPFLANKVIAEACFSNLGGDGVVGPDDPGASESVCPNDMPSQIGVDAGVPCDASVPGCDHGTQVAGVAVGAGVSFNGVAKSGKIISIQVTTKVDESGPYDFDACFFAYNVDYDECVLAYSSDIIDALDHVYSLRNTHKIAAVNLSLGYGAESAFCDTEPEKIAIDNLRSAGIATVVAAGNSGSLFELSVPACISSAIAVGSTLDSADTVSTFSNSSPALDIYAPGEIINSSVPSGGFSLLSGTSMAAPHVAGAWAVIKHAKPSASVNEVEALFDAHGPSVLKSGAEISETRQRLALTEALNTLCASGACDSVGGDMCFPIKAANGKTALICL